MSLAPASRFRFLLFIPALLLTGCQNIINTPTIITIPSPTSVTGNWALTATYIAAQGTGIYGIAALGGPLTLTTTSTTNTLTGIFHISLPCFANGQTNIPLTGSIATGNHFTLTSPAINGETVLVTGVFAASGSTFDQGYLEINGPCTGDLISPTGDVGGAILNPVGTKLASLSRSWTSVVGQSTLSLTEQLTQAATPDANGNFALSGTVAVTGSPCFTSGTLQTGSYISGVTGQQIILMNDGSTLTAPMTISISPYPAPGPFFLFPVTTTGGQCNGTTGIELQ